MKNRRIFIAIVAALCSLAFVACEKEKGTEYVPDNTPIKSISFKTNVPDEAVVTKASDAVETQVDDIAIILINKQNGSRAKVFKTTLGAPTSKPSSTNYLYSLTIDLSDSGLLGGEYYLYAVANYDSKFIEAETALNGLEGMTKEEIDEIIVAKDKDNSDLDLASAVLMTGRYCEGSSTDGSVILHGEGTEYDGNNTLSGTIHLRRIVSKVTVNVKTSTGVKFTPRTYEIVNYSRSSSLFERDGWDGSDPGTMTFFGDSDAFKSRSYVASGNSFFFYMPENVQQPKTSTKLTAYRDREAHTDLTESQEFLNAPDNGTYIVIKGDYSDSDYTGEVIYTVHMGDFSSAYTASNGFGNYSVRRNYKYNYNITISGISKIESECEATDLTPETEPQPGAEGLLVKYDSQSVYTLDAHYEQVMLRFPKPTINHHYILVNTPFTNGNQSDHDDDNDLTEYVGWVKFGAPVSKTQFNGYNSANVVDIYGLISELKADAPANPHYIVVNESGTDYVYVTAYVDEYFYENQALSEFVNAADRVLTLSLSDVKLSQDKQSSLIKDVVFSIRQKSIKSDMKLSTSNPFGIESFEEDEANTNFMTAPTAGSSQTFGWQNFRDLLSARFTIGSTYWNSVVNVASNGHFSSDSDDRGAAMQSNYDYGFYQCLTRNRDENGNGLIDDEELKWYLPSYDQYCVLFIGETVLDKDARLFPQQDGSALYFTSSNGQTRMYFASQGISSNGYKQDDWIKSLIQNGHVRCARSLKSYNTETTTVGTVEDNIISVGGFSNDVLRATPQTTEYSPHVQRDASNSLTYKFEVASADLPTTYTMTSSVDGLTPVSSENVCAGVYSQNGDSEGWRVPSLKEFYMMLKLGTITSGRNYAFRTMYGDTYDSTSDNHFGYNQSSIFTFTKGNSPLGTGYVRCVRDVANKPALTMDVSTNKINASVSEYVKTFKVIASDAVQWTLTSNNSAVKLVLGEASADATGSSSISSNGNQTVSVIGGEAGQSAINAVLTLSTSTPNVDNTDIEISYTREGYLRTYEWELVSGDFISNQANSKGTPAMDWMLGWINYPQWRNNKYEISVNRRSSNDFTLTTSSLAGCTIKDVKITGYSSNSMTTTMSVKVGSGSYVSADSAFGNTSGTRTVDFGDGSTCGTGQNVIIKLTMNNSNRDSQSSFYITKIQITYSAAE